MNSSRHESLAVAALFASGLLWGLTWIPLKHFAATGMSGLAMTLLSYGLVGIVALPWIWRQRGAWRHQTHLLVVAALIGGAANVCFVSGLMLGAVVRVMLMFYLAPVWGVLGARLFLRERLTPSRLAGVAMAMAGALLVLGGPRVLAAPISAADLLGLASGLLYAAQNIVFRAADRVPVSSKALSVFTGCGLVSLLLVAFIGADLSAVTIPVVLQLVSFAGVWMVAAMWTTMYGVTHLEAGRAAVLLVFELVAALASAMLLAGERLDALEWIGAALITGAALLEARSNDPMQRKLA